MPKHKTAQPAEPPPFEAVVKRMLETPPKPHKPVAPKPARGKPKKGGKVRSGAAI